VVEAGGFLPLKPGSPGPVGIPCYPHIFEETVVAANTAWKGNRKHLAWKDHSGGVTDWMRFALVYAHLHPPLKRCVLRLLARTHSSNAEVLSALKAECVQLGKAVAPELEAYYESQVLGSVLAEIAARRADVGGAPLHQGVACPLFDPKHMVALDTAKAKKRITYGTFFLTQAMLVILSYFVDPLFRAACEANLVGPEGSDAVLRPVAVKSFTRMHNKWDDEHKEVEKTHGLVAGALNLDPVRIGVQSATPVGELEVWRRLEAAFPDAVMRVKNLFTTATSELSESMLR
jgi:hypothetical protein